MNKLNSALDRLRNRRSSDKGFTLIELVIVVAIIGILTAIAIPSYGAIQATARANTVATAATDGYTAVQADIASGTAPATAIAAATTKAKGTTDITVTVGGTTADNVSVTAKWKGGDPTSVRTASGIVNTAG